LYLAAASNYKEVCEVLLKSGADKTMKPSGKTAAQHATDQKHFDLATFIESWGKVSTRVMCRGVRMFFCCVLSLEVVFISLRFCFVFLM